MPETNLKEFPDENALYADVGILYRFIRKNGKWSISDEANEESIAQGLVKSVTVLSSGRVLMGCDKTFRFYTDRLKHIKTIRHEDSND